MPRYSKKQQIIRQLDRFTTIASKYCNTANIVGVKVDPSIFDFILTCKCVSKQLQNQRYLTARGKLKSKRQRKFNLYLNTDTDDALSDKEFLFHFRVSRERFYCLLELIKNHTVFKSLDGKGREQAQAAHQLLVLLKYYGSQGNGLFCH